MNILRKTGISAVIAIFGFTAIFCCCLQKEAVAMMAPQHMIVKDEAKLPPCHQTANKDSQKKRSECSCHNNVSDFDTAKTNLKISSFEMFSFVLSPVEILSSTRGYIFESSINRSGGPPGELSSIPLYLKHSILRI